MPPRKKASARAQPPRLKALIAQHAGGGRVHHSAPVVLAKCLEMLIADVAGRGEAACRARGGRVILAHDLKGVASGRGALRFLAGPARDIPTPDAAQIGLQEAAAGGGIAAAAAKKKEAEKEGGRRRRRRRGWGWGGRWGRRWRRRQPCARRWGAPQT